MKFNKTVLIAASLVFGVRCAADDEVNSDTGNVDAIDEQDSVGPDSSDAVGEGSDTADTSDSVLDVVDSADDVPFVDASVDAGEQDVEGSDSDLGEGDEEVDTPEGARSRETFDRWCVAWRSVECSVTYELACNEVTGGARANNDALAQTEIVTAEECIELVLPIYCALFGEVFDRGYVDVVPETVAVAEGLVSSVQCATYLDYEYEDPVRTALSDALISNQALGEECLVGLACREGTCLGEDYNLLDLDDPEVPIVAGVCAVRREAGAACTLDEECVSFECTAGACVDEATP